MKKGLLIVSVLVLLSSCDLTIIEVPFDNRDNFVGRYEAEEYSETYDQLSFFDMRILRDSDDFSNAIYIRNFYAQGIEVYAEVNGRNITIPRQVVDGFVVEGTGRLENGDVFLTYSVDDTYSNGRTDFCNTVLYRR
ncbi:hypothetical protein [Roseivirga misakiensis]|uniref:Lipoprotein n=1 Tax=Roseivirga misakiensis TaxID=1563681 RepID=A0A1E5SZF7_9BACT|nr:hypothetical protein [Roseivirga misakiensis]OEK04499.1 hypothetical protein BFP71_13600 [Roseivirga misakiensis]